MSDSSTSHNSAAPPERLQLSLIQVVASSLAAVTAAVLCSFFGVAGTIVGTAVASVAATVGSTVYAYSIRRTRGTLSKIQVPGTARTAQETAEHPGAPGDPERSDSFWTRVKEWAHTLPWKWIGWVSAVIFVIAMAVVTLIELGIGRSLSDVDTGHTGNSTTIGISTGGKPTHSPSPTTEPSSPGPTTTTTTSPSTTTTPTPTPTETTTESPSPPTSPSISVSPSLPGQ